MTRSDHLYTAGRRVPSTYGRLLVLLPLVLSLHAGHRVAFAQDTSTWLVVRHTDRNGSLDELTQQGVERAEALKEIATRLGVNAVYSTAFKRTQDTAHPTAESIGAKIDEYDVNPRQPDPNFFDELKKRHAGQVVLIVGHSNTVESVLNGLGCEGSFPIKDDEFDKLFIVNTSGPDSTVVQVRYGPPVTIPK